ncbi:MAG: response regulator [Acidobacteria bacterium]|nr:response regulator [Acidobacteriota bacterium]
MPEATTSESTPDAGGEARAHRSALLVAGEACDELSARLSAAGLDITCLKAEETAPALDGNMPSLVLIAFGEREGESALVGLARRLRAEPSTFALPVVFLYRTDERTLRSAALHLGVDDYFAQATPPAEMRARLDSLFWRGEAGRRAAPVVGEQRSEIDNFMFLLDAVSADARRGEMGAVALVVAGTGGAPLEGDAESALAAAHGFLKLNLRRVDSVAFYGPTILLAHLPRMDSRAAQAALTHLREEFIEARPDADLVAGIASFPEDGGEVEKLIEKAESALGAARAPNSPAHILVYAEGGARRVPAKSRGREARAEVGKAATLPSGAAASEGHARSGEQRAGHGALKSRRLLLTVSDASRMAQINLLMRSAGYEVRAAFDAQHALNLLRIDRPDLLLVDYELQGMDGIEMLRRLSKQSGGSPPPPALLLLPAGAENLLGEALGAGAGRVVKLPYDPVELLDALRGIAGLE